MISHLIPSQTIRLGSVLFLIGSLCLATTSNAAQRKAEVLSGPIKARVERIIDGDTLIVKAKIWLGQELTIRVRLAEIDTPEMNASDPHLRKAAWKAYKALFRMAHDQEITLRNIRRGKYAGRVIAETYLAGEINISKELLNMRLAVPYGQKFKTRAPCPAENCPTIKPTARTKTKIKTEILYNVPDHTPQN